MENPFLRPFYAPYSMSDNLNRLRELSEKLTTFQSTLSSFFEFCPDLLAIANKQGYFMRLNPAWEKTLGFTVKELSALPFETFVHPDDLEKTRNALKELTKGDGLYNFENRMRTRNGGYKTLLWNATRYMEDDITYCVARDITESLAVQVKLQSTQSELQDFFENAPVALHWANREGVIEWANNSELEMLGYGREEYIGHYSQEFHVDAQCYLLMREKLLKGETVINQHCELIKKDGQHLKVVISANVFQRDGKFIHTRNFTRDITNECE